MRSGLLVFAFAGIAASAAQASFYQYDDGTEESALTTSSGSPFNALFLTHYVVAPGGETLTSIDLTWGASLGGTLPDGLAADVLLMDDPNNDGNPNDATILQSITTTTVNSNTGLFNNYGLLPLTLTPGTSYFAGAFIQNCPNTTTWVGIDANATGRSADSWWNVAVASPVGSHISLGIFGNPDMTWMVRVNAQPVPEPATLVVLSMAALAFCRRRVKNR